MNTAILLPYFGLLALSLAYENIALRKPAYQQSQYIVYHDASLTEASNAVDGLKSNLSYFGQCAFSGKDKETATWWVNLTSIHSIHHVTIYYMTNNALWGPSSPYTRTFLGFSLYISNTTEKSQGTLCFKDSNYNASTIPPVVNITCPVHGQYVIYYNERLAGVSYPPDYYSFGAEHLLCEVEVYGCSLLGLDGSNCSISCPDPYCRQCNIEPDTCQGCKPGYRGHQCELECDYGFYGQNCIYNCVSTCDGCNNIDGGCDNGCKPGWKGVDCSETCLDGTYGHNCNNTCGNCLNVNECFHTNGTCLTGCDPGYTGDLCETRCDNGTYGNECNNTCGHCINEDVCIHTNGTCLNGCESGFVGPLCKTQGVKIRVWRGACSQVCGLCKNTVDCHHVNGTCLTGCESGYIGDMCKTPCENGTYGSNCNNTCGYCINEDVCFHKNGTCLNGCESGYMGGLCKTRCNEGYFGTECSQVCGWCRNTVDCHHVNGTCLTGCESGYICDMCKTPCENGTYGNDCNNTCGHCADKESCFHSNGTCLVGCDPGYVGELCKTTCSQGTFGKECNASCGNCLGECDHISETCLNGCTPGYIGPLCRTLCSSGKYGEDCNNTCGYCSDQNDCSHVNGTCFSGCDLGYIGALCKTACSNGTYGKECNNTCGYCLDQDECHHINGTCVKGCDPGYLGDLCKTACNSGAYGIECNSTCGYCLDGTSCSHVDGTCLNGCNPGFIGAMCRKRVLEILSFEATSLVVRECTPFEMRLSFRNMTECEFQWFHGDYEVTNTSTRYAMAMSKTDNGTSILTLHIGKSLKRDEGHWKIRVSSHGTFLARNLSIIVIPRLVLVMEPQFDFSIEKGEHLTIECTIQNPESLANIENGSLALTKGGSNLTPSSNTQLSVTWHKGTSVVDDSGVYTCLYTTYPDPVSVSVYATVISQEQKRCNSDISNDIQWNTTLAGITKREPCPPKQKGIATRQCNVEGIWEPPNLINCTTEAFLNASSELDTILEDGITDPEKTSETIDNTLHLMNNLTSSTPELSAGDISSSIDILDKIVNVTNSSGSSIAKEIFFSVVDNVLSSNNSESWNAVSEKTEKDASSLLKNIDRLSEVVIQNDNISATQFTGSNFELTINKTKIDETGIRFPEVTSKNSTEGSDTVSTFFELGKQKRKTDKAMGYVAVIYKNIADILPANSERPDDTEKPSQKKAFVNSRVLSLTTQANIGSLNPPLKLTFQNVQTTSLSGMRPLCVSWNFSTKKWSEQGCILVKRDIKGTVCECDHLTNFAILMRPYSSDTEDEQSLKTISLFGVILSIIFIALTFIIYILTWRFIKSDQNIMMLNLCVSLVLAYVVFISSVEQKDNEGLCVAITAVLHYLFLATFFNMLGMGLYYFMSITVTYYAMYVANNFKSKSRIHWILVGTWGKYIFNHHSFFNV
ncbi:uncharacterized protein LOC111115470 [Crassostrea virginica]